MEHPKFRYRIRKSPLLLAVQSQINSVHALSRKLTIRLQGMIFQKMRNHILITVKTRNF